MTELPKMKPILFSTPMVQAILAGRKTQTRRVVKPAIGWDKEWIPTLIKEEHLDGIHRYEMRNGTKYHLPIFKCPYGQPVDVLWVRETWATNGLDYFRYKADYKEIDEGINGKTSGFRKTYDKWKPSIHMPFVACRIFLKVVSVRVERLQDISEQDAIAEGIEPSIRLEKNFKLGEQFYKHYTDSTFEGADPRSSFKSLWQSINGPDSWQSNPWVWVVEFKQIEKPQIGTEDECEQYREPEKILIDK